jgi:predicted dehydrogenase
MGILGTSDVAYRRFLPSLSESNCFEYAGVASRDISKTIRFVDSYGGTGYESYESILEDESIDAIYIPLPPALHFEWAMKALDKGKHILVEKPFSTTLSDTIKILEKAKKHNLAIHENYMFMYHNQLSKITAMINEGIVGDVMLYRSAFGFPKRNANDFRYNKNLGGGAILDCGGYPVKLASYFLGESTKVQASKLLFDSNFGVDIFGAATLINNDDKIFQIGFGMDNSYKCELEVWGSKGSLKAKRIFTAGKDFQPIITLETDAGLDEIRCSPDDQFQKSILQFYNSIFDSQKRDSIAEEIIRQARLIEDMNRNEVTER